MTTRAWVMIPGLILGLAGTAMAWFPRAPVRRCGRDAVVAGTVCLDKYEATVWRVPNPNTANASLVNRIRLGLATRADLFAGSATQLGLGIDDYAPCPDNGQACADDIYAVSLPAEIPSGFITWFQAQEACANSAKRLPSNAEWQVGANGTPDTRGEGPALCQTQTGVLVRTGANPDCVSARGAFDMVGNQAEWVADWVPISVDCPGWGNFSDDVMCLAGATTAQAAPGALVRGGLSFGGAINGPLSVIGTIDPTRSEDFIGFRCAR